MIKKWKNQIYQNQRSFYAVLCVLSLVIIQLVYIVNYNFEPAIITSLIPIILWIMYDGNEHEKATEQGSYIWIFILIIITILVCYFPQFPLIETFVNSIN